MDAKKGATTSIIKKSVSWLIGIVSVALLVSCLSIGSPKTAEAASLVSVPSFADVRVPASEAYITTLNWNNATVTLNNTNYIYGKIKTNTSGTDDTRHAIYREHKVTSGEYSSVNVATVKFPNAGFTTNNRQIDVTFTVSDLTYVRNVTKDSNDNYKWLPDFQGFTVLTSDPNSNTGLCFSSFNIDKDGKGHAWFGAGARYKVTMRITYAGTNTGISEVYQAAFADLDTPDKVSGGSESWSGAYAESIELISGFSNSTYVTSATTLVASKTNTHYRGKQLDNTATSVNSTVLTYSPGGSCSFWWAGSTCATDFGVFYYNYPPWNAPTKQASKSPVALTESYTYTIGQYFPYTLSSLVPSGITMSDTLYSALDAAGATVKVYKGSITSANEVTGQWSKSVSGQRITMTANNRANAVGQYYFQITTRVLGNANLSGLSKTTTLWQNLSNQATTSIAAGGVNGTSKNTNVANINVYVPKLSLTKTSSVSALNVNETAKYTLKATQTASGAIAPQVVLTDTMPSAFYSGGGSISNIKVMKGSTDITSSCTIAFSSNKYTITTRQNLGYNESITVTYDAKFGTKTSRSLLDTTIRNTATATAQNTAAVTATRDVYVAKPIFDVTKKSNVAKTNTGEAVDYTVTVKLNKSTHTVAKAWDAYITDAISANFYNEGGTLSKWSVRLNGNAITDSCTFSKSGSTSTFKLNRHLAYSDVVVINYTLTYGEQTNQGLLEQTMTNIASALSPNAITGSDSNVVQVVKPQLNITKSADLDLVNTSNVVNYSINVSQTPASDPAAKVWNLVIDDLFSSGFAGKGGSIIKDSFVIKINGKDVTADTIHNIKAEAFNVDFRVPILKNDVVEITYDVKYGETVDIALVAATYIDTAKSSGLNADTVRASSGVVVAEPKLTVQKAAGVDYANIGEAIPYKVTVQQTDEDGIAWNVVLKDAIASTAYEAGAYIDKSSLKITGKNGEPILDGANIEWKDDSAKPSGFTIKTNYHLAYLETIAFEYDVIAGSTTSRDLQYTQISNDVIASSDNSASANDSVFVEFITPELTMSKTASKKIVNTSDVITYEIVANQIDERGIAWNIIVADMIPQEIVEAGATYLKDSLRVFDTEDKDITDSCDVAFSEDMTSFVVTANTELRELSSLKVVYDVQAGSVDSRQLQLTGISNVATVTSDSADPVVDSEQVSLFAPRAEITKTSNTDTVNTGDDVEYEIVVCQPETEGITWDVRIEDSLDTSAYEAGVRIMEESIVVAFNDENITDTCEIELEDNVLAIDTKINMTKDDVIVVKYTASMGETTGVGIYWSDIRNRAIVSGANIDTPEDSVDIESLVPDFELEKKADKSELNAGDSANFTIVARQLTPGAIAHNVVLRDALTFEIPESFDLEDLIAHTKVEAKLNNHDIPLENITTDYDFTEEGSATLWFEASLGEFTHEDVFELTYRTTYGKNTTHFLNDQTIVNKATIVSDNAETIEQSAAITVLEPTLSLTKEVDKETIVHDERAHYTLTVINETTPGNSAKNVVIEDELSEKAAVEGFKIVPETIVVYDTLGMKITSLCDISVDESATKMQITVGNMKYKDVIMVTYECSTTNIDSRIEELPLLNTAKVSADNVKNISAENTLMYTNSGKHIAIEPQTKKKPQSVVSSPNLDKDKSDRPAAKSALDKTSDILIEWWLVLLILFMAGGVILRVAYRDRR